MNSPAIQSLSVQCNTCHLNKPSVTAYPNAPELDPRDDPTKLLPCLLDQIVAPGQFAQQLSLAFGGNGHHSDKLLVCRNLASTEQTSADPAKLLPQLLDRLIELGDLARGISRALGGNGHRANKAAELIQQLMNERR